MAAAASMALDSKRARKSGLICSESEGGVVCVLGCRVGRGERGYDIDMTRRRLWMDGWMDLDCI